MQKIELKHFKALDSNPDVYLSHTDTFTLISIPAWNWSFLWPYERKEEHVKIMLMSSLWSTHRMKNESEKKFVEELHQYLPKKQKG